VSEIEGLSMYGKSLVDNEFQHFDSLPSIISLRAWSWVVLQLTTELSSFQSWPLA